ncbi:MAG: alpha/beta fold hydrolase [Actinomycetota bacterium]
MPNADVNGLTIAYEEYGNPDGAPLLLVMGLGGQLVDWPPEFVELFGDRFRVIAFDNRDIGLSSETTGPMMTPQQYFKSRLTRRAPAAGYLIADMADDAAGLLDHLGIHSAHVVGVSMGGMIAQTLAFRHRSRVRSLTSIMSNTGNRRNGQAAASLMAKAARRKPPTRETALEDVVETYALIAGPERDEARLRESAEASIARSWRPQGTARQLLAIHASPDRTPDLRTITAPTLVVHGLVDPLVKPSGGVATAKAVPGSRLLMFPDMGHDLPRSRWVELVDAITRNAARDDRSLGAALVS